MEKVVTQQYRYTVIFEPAQEGGYVVTVPALPGCATQGETLEEARQMVKEAIAGYLESLTEHGEEIPIEHGEPIKEQIAVRISKP